MTLPVPRRFCRLLAVIGLGCLASLHAAPVRFDIPAQPATSALPVFIKQSGTEVLFIQNELEKVRTNAVVGEFEAGVALDQLLRGTGFGAKRNGAGFVIAKLPPATGSLRGSLSLPNGAPAAGVLVVVRETSQSAETDQDGQFFFNAVAPGSHVLVARADGYQPLHITDVVIKAGNELSLSRETLHKPADGLTVLEPFVVHAETVEQLDKYSVYGSKQKPFESGNMDITRTIDDVQPYTIFDAKTIDQSGAATIEDFLKQRLTMNATSLTNADTAVGTAIPVNGNKSQIDLRGLGTDKTLILVNGRRLPGSATFTGTEGQPDLNGIPLASIERIEVLPSSASGIYGGSAIGGVINVILKRNYTGGELRTTYDNTFDTDSPRRSVSLSYGFGLEGGRTRVMLSASVSDSKGLLMQDRLGLYAPIVRTLDANSPTFIPNRTGIYANIQSSLSLTALTPLTLKTGGVIPSGLTYVPAGVSPTTTLAQLSAGLLANSGTVSPLFPNSYDFPFGLLRQLATDSQGRTFSASVRRQMFPRLEVFADYSYTRSETSMLQSFYENVNVPAAAPTNPFTTAAVVRVAGYHPLPADTASTSYTISAGLLLHLPKEWTAEFDYTWNKTISSYHWANSSSGSVRRSPDILSGAINPFLDPTIYPFPSYQNTINARQPMELADYALRASGDLFSLPWGKPTLTVGLEERVAQNLSGRYTAIVTPSDAGNNDVLSSYFPRKQVTDSGYAELDVPLVKRDWLPFVHALEAQFAGRQERFAVGTGTTNSTYNFNTGATTYIGTTLNGQPYFSKATYSSSNGTAGLKFEPVPGVTIRASAGQAFLPPTPVQLVKNQTASTTTTQVTDPKTGQNVGVFTLAGGNPDLTPQTSASFNAGLVWQPTWAALRGLRVNVEYYRIKQMNFISALGAQQIVDLESLYPERVTRNASGTITQVDISSLNLYRRSTTGWDLSGDYTIKLGAGRLNLRAAGTILTHLQNQFSLTLPMTEAVNYPSESGAVKYKANGTVTWEQRNWSLGWTMNYVSGYRQTGAVGSPSAVTRLLTGTTDAARAPVTTTTLAQGGNTIPSQAYHDVFGSYAFGHLENTPGSRRSAIRAALFDDITVSLGVKNVLNDAPPMDAFYSTHLYTSPFGDLRLRSYWVTVKKTF